MVEKTRIELDEKIKELRREIDYEKKNENKEEEIRYFEGEINKTQDIIRNIYPLSLKEFEKKYKADLKDIFNHFIISNNDFLRKIEKIFKNEIIYDIRQAINGKIEFEYFNKDRSVKHVLIDICRNHIEKKSTEVLAHFLEECSDKLKRNL